MIGQVLVWTTTFVSCVPHLCEISEHLLREGAEHCGELVGKTELAGTAVQILNGFLDGSQILIMQTVEWNCGQINVGVLRREVEMPHIRRSRCAAEKPARYWANPSPPVWNRSVDCAEVTAADRSHYPFAPLLIRAKRRLVVRRSCPIMPAKDLPININRRL